MRKLRILPAVFMMATLFSACTTHELPNISLPGAESVIPGTYRVNFFDDGSGTANAFEGYTFQFNSDGTLTATNGSEDFTGSWAIENTNLSDVYDKLVTITIDGNSDMQVLNQPWFVSEVTDVTLQLTDDVANEQVHFIKI